jgi:formate-dependent nitrite reductase membrane component NrfD
MTIVKPYLWMTDFTPQREWIDNKGLLLWLAFFFSEIGAGVYMVSLFSGFWAGCLVGWLSCAVLGGGLHMAYLGRPGRAWRSILRPGSSELSRGIIGMGLFLGVGVFQLAPELAGGLPWGGEALFFKIVLSIFAFFVITHGFMTLSFMRALPFWNSGLMPVLSLASGLWVGTQVLAAIAMCYRSTVLPTVMEPIARWFLFSYVLFAVFYLWSAWHGPMAAKRSLLTLLKGELAPVFYPGVILVAFVVPVLITLYLWGRAVDTAQGALWLRIMCALGGDLALRYSILKAARYVPLINTNIISGAQWP